MLITTTLEGMTDDGDTHHTHGCIYERVVGSTREEPLCLTLSLPSTAFHG